MKRSYQAGGRAIYTWQKQPQDKYTTAFGVALISLGILQLIPGYWKLATGKGKME
jgi:hypothetical protein